MESRVIDGAVCPTPTSTEADRRRFMIEPGNEIPWVWFVIGNGLPVGNVSEPKNKTRGTTAEDRTYYLD